MKKLLLFLFLSASVLAQQKNIFPYQNTKLPVEERANDLVCRMTLAEKISQMNYDAPAIERLGIPKYNWWNECLHGVARNGLATVFPQAIGLAATWDKNLTHKVANAISDEARAKYNIAVSQNKRGIYQGLTFWSPNINIFRDPRWGRGMETYGEDPYLTGSMAVQFIKGLQGDNPKYLKVVATAKHFAVHSGPEPDRHTFDAEISEYDLRETYLPAFKMCVHDANVQSIMCAYNSVRGKACCSNDPILEKILREEWGFKGYVVSDCWAISDIYQYHKQAADAGEASAVSVKAGTDLECGNSFPKLLDAVNRGLIKEDDLNISLKRLFEARIKLGMFDPPELVPFSKLGRSNLDTKQNRKLALQAARESIVLLKNKGNLLPLKKSLKTIAVIGPNVDDEEILYGNYNGYPSHPVTPLEGIKEKLRDVNVVYERGCDIAQNIPSFDIIPSSCLFTSADKKQNGLAAEYFDNSELKGELVLKKIDTKVDFNWWDNSPLKNSTANNFGIRWSGYIVPDKSGKYAIGGYGLDAFQIYFEDTLLTKFSSRHEATKIYKLVNLEAGKAYKLKIDYHSSERSSFIQLIWSVPAENFEQRAIAAAKKSDAVILFMGLSPRLEGEEMDVEVEGFKGGDRTSLDLPHIQEELIKKITALGKPTVLVLLNGSAVSINWENENIPAIIESWYGGEEAGDAIADVLFGDYNPAGRLPVTFYKSVEQLPDFKDYNMRSGNASYVMGNSVVSYRSKTLGRTYRYFESDPLYPFGYGLSYTTFEYKNLRLSKDKIKNGEPVKLLIDVKNTGKVSGDEVVQLYVKGSIFDTDGPIKTLEGFERISLKPDQTKTVEFEITPKTLEEFFGDKGFTVEKGEHVFMVGSSSCNDDLKKISLTVE